MRNEAKFESMQQFFNSKSFKKMTIHSVNFLFCFKQKLLHKTLVSSLKKCSHNWLLAMARFCKSLCSNSITNQNFLQK